MCIRDRFITDKGQPHCEIKLQPIIIVSVLVPLKTVAQLAFYTLTRADKRGLFSNNRRATCWNICNKKSDDTAPGLVLGRSDLLSDETLTAYVPIFVAQDQNPQCQGVKKKKRQIRMTSANTGCSVSVYTKQIWMEMEKKTIWCGFLWWLHCPSHLKPSIFSKASVSWGGVEPITVSAGKQDY